MAVSIDPLKTGTSDEVNPTFASLTVSGPVTLSGGTANGIAYLNGSKVLTTGSDLTWNGETLGVAGPINASGGIESLASVSVTKDGSDSIGSGPLMQVRNEGGRRSWAQQLSASNNLDWWHLDGSWTKYMTLSTAGLAVTGSISATGTATLSDAVYFQKELALLNTMAEPATIANRSQIYVDVADGLLKLKDGAGVVKVFGLT